MGSCRSQNDSNPCEHFPLRWISDFPFKTGIIAFLTLLSAVVSQANVFPADQSSKKFRVAIQSLPDSVDPTKIVDINSAFVLNQVYDGLYEYSGQNALIPRIAESHIISPDGKTISIQIRRESRFSDGTEILAIDVAKSMSRAIRLLGNESEWAFGELEGFSEYLKNPNDLTRLSGITVEGPKKIKFQLKHPFAQFLQVLTSPYFSILKEENGRLIGSGSWLIKSQSKDRIVLLPVDSKNFPKKAPEQVEFIKVSDFGNSLKLAARHEIDFFDIYELKEPLPEHYRLFEYEYLQLVTILLNNRSDKFRNSESRCFFAKQFALAARQTGYLLQPTSAGLPYAWNLLPSEEASGPMAKKMSVSVVYTQGVSSLNSKLLSGVKEKLKTHGVTLEPVKLDHKELFKRFRSGGYEAGIMSYVPDYLDPDAFLTPFIYSGQQYNWMGYSDKKVDALLKSARQVSNPEKRAQIYRGVFGLMARDCPVFFLGSQVGKIVVNSNWSVPAVSGLGYHTIKIRNIEAVIPEHSR